MSMRMQTAQVQKHQSKYYGPKDKLISLFVNQMTAYQLTLNNTESEHGKVTGSEHRKVNLPVNATKPEAYLQICHLYTYVHHLHLREGTGGVIVLLQGMCHALHSLKFTDYRVRLMVMFAALFRNDHFWQSSRLTSENYNVLPLRKLSLKTI